MGCGLMAAQEGAMVKRLHAGRAAQGGMLAALLAKRGFTGIPDVVEAGYGRFLSSFSRSPNVQRLMEGLREVGGRQGRLQNVSQRHQYSLGARRLAIDSGRRKPAAVTDRANQCRLRSHDVRAYGLGISPGRDHGSADEHVLRPQRDEPAKGRIGCRLFRRCDCGSGNSRVYAADQDCRYHRTRRTCVYSCLDFAARAWLGRQSDGSTRCSQKLKFHRTSSSWCRS
jgi:MmgE/PrpD N-terminal domain